MCLVKFQMIGNENHFVTARGFALQADRRTIEWVDGWTDDGRTDGQIDIWIDR